MRNAVAKIGAGSSAIFVSGWVPNLAAWNAAGPLPANADDIPASLLMLDDSAAFTMVSLGLTALIIAMVDSPIAERDAF